ncbi:substrate-binding domain-containing protein [Streptomyces sp. RB6PN25]|uniref:Substrate-binding domain-containing protein n=2 Tax=Streptomyces humicola TaxID=2953240 RepID=A0ABT1PQV5_9ACTN|nr:substrate-binding domain-containing protein [Streptomyces humicola]MCQ4079523.1 substrate-binding domain-containing protein [Streptomyces humicola]
MWRCAASAAMAVAMSIDLAACAGKPVYGTPRTDAASVAEGFAVGLALPETQTTRYDAVDRPTIRKKLQELCPKCTLDYKNAGGDANVQRQQIDALIRDGVKVIILDAVDYRAIRPSVDKAHALGIKVVAYDRLAQGAVDAYASFDNTEIGKQQGEGLLQALGSRATPASRIVMIDGDRDDPNAAQFKAGAHSALDGKVTIAAEYDTDGWLADNANKEVADAIARLGKDNIAAVYSANDGMATGVISALQSAGIAPLPPVSGQDAQLDAVQRVIAGTQAFTIYKPYVVEAETAAEMAIDVATGTPIDIANTTVSNGTDNAVPARLVDTAILDASDIRQTVVADGLYTIDQICTPQYAQACAKAGLK